MIHECTNPVPCSTPLGDGWVWYIKENGMYENDELVIILTNGGQIKHFTTEQVNIWHNETYGILKKTPF